MTVRLGEVGGSIPLAGWFLAACCFLVAGCAQTRLSQEPGLVRGWDRSQAPAALHTPTISLELYSRHLSFGEPVESPIGKWWTKRSVRQQLEDTLDEFPFLARAAWNDNTIPSRLVIEATHATQGNKKLHWLSETTKYVIPCTYQASVALEARLFHGPTLVKRYEAVGTYRVRRHLLWLLTPWTWHPRALTETMKDTFRDLLLQLQQDVGLLGAAPAAEG